jgi:uncharacterized protein YkwD
MIIKLSRRSLLSAAALLSPSLAGADAAEPDRVAVYDRRLRARLADAGGAAFEPEFEEALFQLGNAFRVQQGLGELLPDPGLILAARAQSGDIADRGRFDHVSLDGFGPVVRVGLLARDMIGAPAENLAARISTGKRVSPEQIMDQWKNSPGHRATLLARGLTHVGYGALRRGDEVIAAGAYSEVSAWLDQPAPGRIADVQAISQILRRASPGMSQFSISLPGQQALAMTYLEGSATAALPPGAWQLRPHVGAGPHQGQVAWGPIVFA